MLAMAGGKTQRNSAYEKYFEKYKAVAIEQMAKYKIPASITLAQGVYESGAGSSQLARKANNHFGIKCHNGWKGRSVSYDDDERGECFRAYGSVWESYEDHSKFLTGSKRYSSLFHLKITDYKGWARGLKKCGYATNPQYAKKLIEIIELYDLDQYDTRRGKRKKSDDYWQPMPGEEHRVYFRNENYYVVARDGDTFASIGEEMGVKGKKIAKYNERDYDYRLEAGDIVYLEPKKTEAAHGNDYHKVVAGDSMYSIAQKYGIRLKSLYQLNRMPLYYEIQVGDELRLR